MKECFLKEAEKTANDIKKNLNDGDICFAMLTDSHLSDTGDCTRENISAVDEKIGFDFCVHMGGIVNGNNPEDFDAAFERGFGKICQKHKIE